MSPKGTSQGATDSLTTSPPTQPAVHTDTPLYYEGDQTTHNHILADYIRIQTMNADFYQACLNYKFKEFCRSRYPDLNPTTTLLQKNRSTQKELFKTIFSDKSIHPYEKSTVVSAYNEWAKTQEYILSPIVVCNIPDENQLPTDYIEEPEHPASNMIPTVHTSLRNKAINTVAQNTNNKLLHATLNLYWQQTTCGVQRQTFRPILNRIGYLSEKWDPKQYTPETQAIESNDGAEEEKGDGTPAATISFTLETLFQRAQEEGRQDTATACALWDILLRDHLPQLKIILQKQEEQITEHIKTHYFSNISFLFRLTRHFHQRDDITSLNQLLEHAQKHPDGRMSKLLRHQFLATINNTNNTNNNTIDTLCGSANVSAPAETKEEAKEQPTARGLLRTTPCVAPATETTSNDKNIGQLVLMKLALEKQSLPPAENAFATLCYNICLDSNTTEDDQRALILLMTKMLPRDHLLLRSTIRYLNTYPKQPLSNMAWVQLNAKVTQQQDAHDCYDALKALRTASLNTGKPELLLLLPSSHPFQWQAIQFSQLIYRIDSASHNKAPCYLALAQNILGISNSHLSLRVYINHRLGKNASAMEKPTIRDHIDIVRFALDWMNDQHAHFGDHPTSLVTLPMYQEQKQKQKQELTAANRIQRFFRSIPAQTERQRTGDNTNNQPDPPLTSSCCCAIL